MAMAWTRHGREQLHVRQCDGFARLRRTIYGEIDRRFRARAKLNRVAIADAMLDSSVSFKSDDAYIVSPANF
jgi:hypothetical protein